MYWQSHLQKCDGMNVLNSYQDNVNPLQSFAEIQKYPRCIEWVRFQDANIQFKFQPAFFFFAFPSTIQNSFAHLEMLTTQMAI